MASKILTESEVYNIGKKGTATANLLCTYARAEALGCELASGYSLASNQLVYEGSVKQKETTLTFKNESSTYAITLQYKAYYDGAYHEIATIGAGPQTSNTFTLQTKGTWTLYLSDAYTINTNTGKHTAASVANSVYGWGNKVIVVSSSNGYSVSIGVDSGSS